MSRTTIVVASLVGLLAVAVIVDHRREPVYGGQPLSYWVRRLNNRSDKPAQKALREMGWRAIPGLIRMLRSGDETNEGQALNAVVVVGDMAGPALPEILPLLTNQSSQVKIRAFFALKAIYIDPAWAKPFLPILFDALNDPEWTMRAAAVETLDALDPQPPEVAPELFRLLKDPNSVVRDKAMDRLVARTNLIVLPVLDRQLHETDTYVVTKAASWIGHFGPAAEGSAARLRELCNDPQLTVCMAATNALHAITGEFPAVPARKGADISMNLQNIPLQQAMSMYERWAGKSVTPPDGGWPSAAVLSVITVDPLTTNEALQAIENAVRQQAHIAIRHADDGSLSAAPE